MKSYCPFDFHVLNACQLQANCIKANVVGLSENMHMKVDTGYASVFLNIDASTMQPHREFDMNMTTIFIPDQDWRNKEPNHLQFRFHLTEKEDGILSIPMKPGSIIYFHAYLLTHHQIHDNGRSSIDGCCLNYSAYANRKLLCYFIKSYHRAKLLSEKIT